MPPNNHAVVKLSDIALMLLGTLKAWEDAEIGDTHPMHTMQEQVARLDRHTHLSLGAIENGLYYCNMLNEKGDFPKTYCTFEDLVKSIQLTSGRKFDLDLNLLEGKNDIR